MKCNIGKTDRNLRIILGVAIIAGGAFMQSWLALIGIVPIVTGLLRWCPFYVPFKLSSDKK